MRRTLATLGALATLASTGCARHGQQTVTVTSLSSTPASTMSESNAPGAASSSPADPAVQVGRAYVQAICGYSWTLPYGQQMNAALAQYGGPAFAAKRRWSIARTASIAAQWQTDHALAVCGLVTGGVLPDSPAAAVVRQLRFSATVTESALNGSTSTGQVPYFIKVQRIGSVWKVVDDAPIN